MAQHLLPCLGADEGKGHARATLVCCLPFHLPLWSSSKVLPIHWACQVADSMAALPLAWRCSMWEHRCRAHHARARFSMTAADCAGGRHDHCLQAGHGGAHHAMNDFSDTAADCAGGRHDHRMQGGHGGAHHVRLHHLQRPLLHLPQRRHHRRLHQGCQARSHSRATALHPLLTACGFAARTERCLACMAEGC